jgi:alpha/beta superfamily hydrolase
MPHPCSPEPLVNESIRFLAGPFCLEGELAYPEESPPIGAVVVAGPHPLLGGNMHNNVVRALGDCLVQHDLVTLRFNYQGVGRSEGPAIDLADQMARFWKTSHVPEELYLHEDLAGAIVFLRSVIGASLPLALVGYSFGCVLLPRVLDNTGPETPLVLVAPTIGVHDYKAYEPVVNPKLVIAPEGDFAADAGRLHQWFERLARPRQLIEARLDNHFFRGFEDWLVRTVADYLWGQWR